MEKEEQSPSIQESQQVLSVCCRHVRCRLSEFLSLFLLSRVKLSSFSKGGGGGGGGRESEGVEKRISE